MSWDNTQYLLELGTIFNRKITLIIKGKNPGSVLTNIYLKENISIMDTIEIKIVSLISNFIK
jgi:hypothetical protein